MTVYLHNGNKSTCFKVFSDKLLKSKDCSKKEEDGKKLKKCRSFLVEILYTVASSFKKFCFFKQN